MKPDPRDRTLGPGAASEPMVLLLSAEHRGRLIVEPVRIPRGHWGAYHTLARAFRQPPKWRGLGSIQVLVDRPEVLHRALRGFSDITDARALETAAGISWILPAEFRGGVLHLQDWLARAKDHLTALLRDRKTRSRKPTAPS